MPIKEYNKTVTNYAKLHDKIDILDFSDTVEAVGGDSDYPGKVFVTLTTDLSASNQTVLDNTVANFSDAIEALKVPKIYGFAKAEAVDKHFHNIIYTSNKELTQSLIPKRTVVKGEVVQVCWYETATVSIVGGLPVTAFENLIIKVDITYVRDAFGMAVDRSVVRTYINEDESENPETKLSYKPYFANDNDPIDEGTKRRSLLVSSIQKPVLEAMNQVLLPMGQNSVQILLQGRQFMTDYHDEFDSFIEESASDTNYGTPNFNKKLVIIKLEEENDPMRNLWLDSVAPRLGGVMTIREFLIEEFNI